MNERRKDIEKYVKSLSKEELQKQLINRMINDQYDDVRSQYFDEDEDDKELFIIKHTLNLHFCLA